MEKDLSKPLHEQTPSPFGLTIKEKPLEISATPVPDKDNSNNRKNTTPDLLQLPNPSKFPDRRYTSPTDLIISPVSKRLLARNGKTGTFIAQAKNPSMEAGFFGM